MTRRRLRPAHSGEELRQMYAVPHDHRNWAGHRLRVSVTREIARWLAGDTVDSAADLSCGSGAVLNAVPARRKHFGDFAPGYEFHGPLEQTLLALRRVDLFLCCETLEHLDDPDAVLALMREKAGKLVLSTPVDAWDDTNPEHYWAWSRADVEAMLFAAGWDPYLYAAADFRLMGLPYCFGIWGAR